MDFAQLLASFASAFTQERRLVTLHLGDGDAWSQQLLPQAVSGEEALSQPYRYVVECVASDAGLELKRLLGLPAQLGILTADGGEVTRCGVVTRAQALPSDGGFARYGLTIEPPLALLRHHRSSRVWQDLTAPEIVKAIVEEQQAANPVFAAAFALRLDLSRDYPARSYCLQYRETSLAFVQRLLAEEGIAYRFEHEPGDTPRVTLVAFDDPYSLPQATHGRVRFHRADATEAEDSVTDWTSARRVGPEAVALASFDYKPVVTRHTQQQSATDQGNGGGQAEAGLEDYDAQTLYYAADPEQLDRYTLLRQQAHDLAKKAFQGGGTVRGLKVGEWFQLADHPLHDSDAPEQREFVASRLRFAARNNLPGDLLQALGIKEAERPFDVEFEAQRRGIALVPDYASQQRPTAPGAQTATVVGPRNGDAAADEVHTDQHGRIKVQFHWQRAQEHPEFGANLDDKSSCWLRVAHPSAGAGWGHQFIPRVGQEVLVDFIEGDIDRPLVVGVLYNGSHPPPDFSGAGTLPANKTLSGIKTKEHQGGQYGELLFDDTQNEVRTKLSSEHGKTQLNQGYLAHPRANGKAEPRGEGFELRSDRAGAIRAAQGLLLSTEAKPGASGAQLDREQALAQLQAAQQLAQTLGDTASGQLADTVETGPDGIAEDNARQGKRQRGNLAHLNGALEAWTAGSNADRDGKGGEQPGRQPILVASAPAGIGLTTPNELVLSSGGNLDTVSQRDTQQTTARRWIHNAGSKISLFVQGVADKVNLKLIAAKGHARLHALSGDVEIVGDKNLRIYANKEKLEAVAKQELLLTCGGAYIRLAGGNIEIHAPGAESFKAASFSFTGPTSLSKVAPPAPPPKERYHEQFVVTDKHTGLPLVHTPYRVETADGQVFHGVTDGEGRTTRIHTPDARQLKLYLD
ncbi:type IV secretion protein Rhs [Chitiniphilus shinanonensis]|uniref:Type IV secretion protein Rhs n=1 Tax=Chitiniphilus shinanonensis TaxID=553088 RepID=A0ABQ6BPH4_9NEIS|nr:type VI secretion system Vgr family protein [Chitiniphilus shinanonensis]GLS03726.1 type IV secretion protein Rhs [Chitiniphilus shinanonensis]